MLLCCEYMLHYQKRFDSYNINIRAMPLVQSMKYGEFSADMFG